ncbi:MULTISPECIES: NirD/YgiW/YdeI family stress tolerance protein [Moraxella]|uniref:NirD/YgiW/YdeI family stress tolerance protein n=1 Tax=Moraxella nasicaprae TaxID=2904122 RepID=A0ABY6F6N9_9GAMM|nr:MULTISPECIES: NirD/YgiW/YdeI family stress tolerance protein [Moraxella]MDO4894850.1 NirD/YgiW/YdeI family stress tolerance protein [Moraxella sp.]UXZ05758.1 NirD/YgiW/YdeI family stress tolerance protein [Moraxella nasicaprae]
MKVLKTMLATLLIGTTAMTAQANYGTQTVQAAAVKTMMDDSHVSITGKIVRVLGREKFELQDTSGKVIVEIDDDYYHNPQELVGKNVTITGEVDISRKSNRVEIDADFVQIH